MFDLKEASHLRREEEEEEEEKGGSLQGGST